MPELAFILTFMLIWIIPVVIGLYVLSPKMGGYKT